MCCNLLIKYNNVKAFMNMIFLDVETTGTKGFDSGKVKICSMAMIKVDDTGNEVATFYQEFNPEKEVEPGASKANGFTLELLKDKPLFKEKYIEILRFIDNETLVCHNADFDMNVLTYELLSCNIKKRFKFIDTLAISCDLTHNKRQQLHLLVKHDLDSMTEYYHLPNLRVECHDALADTRMLKNLYRPLMEEYHSISKNKDFVTFKELVNYALSKDVDLYIDEALSCPRKECKPYRDDLKAGLNPVSPFNNSFKGKVWLDKAETAGCVQYNTISFRTAEGHDQTFLLGSIKKWHLVPKQLRLL